MITKSVTIELTTVERRTYYNNGRTPASRSVVLIIPRLFCQVYDLTEPCEIILEPREEGFFVKKADLKNE